MEEWTYWQKAIVALLILNAFGLWLIGRELRRLFLYISDWYYLSVGKVKPE